MSFTEQAITRAAQVLWSEGHFHSWWPAPILDKSFEQFCADDPNGKDDFLDLVARMLRVASLPDEEDPEDRPSK